MMRRPSLRESFEQAIRGARLDQCYQFGTEHADAWRRFIPGARACRIGTLDQLAKYFNAFEDFTGKVSINSEIQRYQPFNPINHRFVQGALNLEAEMPEGGWDDVVLCNASSGGVSLDGSPTALSEFVGLDSTDGLEVGQLVCAQFKGTYYIAALTADSITLEPIPGIGNPTSEINNNMLAFLPVYSAELSQQCNIGDLTMVFSSLPAGVVEGMQLGYVSSSTLHRSDDYLVKAINGNTVTLSRTNGLATLPVGKRIVFLPMITSGQIWTKAQWDLTGDMYFACELDCQLMRGSYDVQTRLQSRATINSMPDDVPWGAWPAFWMYSADDGEDWMQGSSEIDILELWWSVTSGPDRYSGGNIGEGELTDGMFLKKNAGWINPNTTVLEAPYGLGGPRKIQMIFTQGRTYKYLDGILARVDRYEWTSQRKAQIGINLACGSISRGFGANFQFPMRAANLASHLVAVKNLRVWYDRK